MRASETGGDLNHKRPITDRDIAVAIFWKIRAARRHSGPALVDRFVERLNASDLPGLLALMLDTATIDIPQLGGGGTQGV